ncbi:ribonuclease [Bacillus methanolicus]|uniref:YlzJ-like family protein n=1 Tax=Bacillus methanolicus TaxID=1471 RepID=UPI0023807971|nr:YlzJ-like family protein [Bacillus methanolicus]MDE3838575.1 ribonuclease [Bacillus methanolicus]
MILYTMMPHELVFPTEDHEFGKQRTIIYNGVPLLVEMEDDHSFRIVRNLSSDPKHYLDSRCNPGEKISYF